MKSNQNAMMFRNGLLATAMMSLTFSPGARADDKSATIPGTAVIAAAGPVEGPDWMEGDQAGFEEDLAGDWDEWVDYEGDPVDYEDGEADFEGEWEDFEDGSVDLEDGEAGIEDDWGNFEDGPVDTEGDWEESGDFEDYPAEFGDGESYAGEFYELFRAFASGGKPAIPGGWETVDRFSAKVKAVAKFAVRKQNHGLAASDSQIELIRVLYARQQVVSGVNYSVRLELNDEGTTRIVRAKVWFRPGSEKPYKLLKWTWLPSAKKVKR